MSQKEGKKGTLRNKGRVRVAEVLWMEGLREKERGTERYRLKNRDESERTESV